ncbi:MAG TPA: TraB/GumN family protein [Brevundimonas sp.]|nr:TraB/GumN family protein [Brevundimonas sp.]
MRRGLVGAFAALFLSLAAMVAAPARAEPALWRVTDADTEMVLFGSVHTLPEHIEWRDDALDAVLASADLVVFEILTPETEEEQWAMVAPLMEYMYSPRPLREVLSAPTWARLEALMTDRAMPVIAFEHLRPWAASMMLEIAISEEQGSLEDLGVDTVLEQSLAADKRTEALDTPALLLATIQALAAYGDAEAEDLLVQTLDWIEAVDQQPDWQIEEAWSAGEVEVIAGLVEEMKIEAPLLYQALMTDRNTAWMPALERMMQTEARVVVIVGAAHMAGPDGLPALLRAAGYAVEGP